MTGRRVLSGVVAFAAGLLALAPGEAHADCAGSCPTYSGSGLPLGAMGAVFTSPVWVGGLVTDVAITMQLDAERGVGRGWSRAGVVLWSAETAVSIPFFVLSVASERTAASLVPSTVFMLFSGASLGLSVAGLLRSPVRGTSNARAWPTVLPVVAATREGMPSVGLVGSF